MDDLMEMLKQFAPDEASQYPKYSIAGLLDRNKQDKHWDSVAQSMYKALTPTDGQDGSVAAHPLGDQDAFKALSREDRIQKVKGYIQGEVLKGAVQQRKQQQTQLEAAMRQNQAYQAAAAALPELLGADPGNGGSGPSGDSVAPTSAPDGGSEETNPDVPQNPLLQAVSRPAATAPAMSGAQRLLGAIRTIGQKNPLGASLLVQKFGPQIMSAVGQDKGPKDVGAPESMVGPDGTLLYFNRTSPGFQISPFSKTKAAADNRTPAKGATVKVPDPNAAARTQIAAQKAFRGDFLKHSEALDKVNQTIKGMANDDPDLPAMLQHRRALASMAPKLEEYLPQGAAAPAAPAAAPAPAQQFKKGQIARQNGKTFKFDGSTWQPVVQ